MKKQVKKRSWLYYFYKENVMYVWVVIGIVIVSGFSIGLSIGKLSENDNLKIDKNISQNKTQNDFVAYNNSINKNTIPIEQENNNTNKTNTNTDMKANSSIEITSTNIEKVAPKLEKKLQFIMPIQGDIMRDFTTDTLVYSNTLQEWISHEGIDILSQISSPVKSIEAGEVVEVKNDPRYGLIVIINHGQGFESIYCNLSTLDMVHIGKKVEKGQVISGVGNTALFEIKDNPHLHFEITKDGKSVNPLEYIE